jgi:hypothetical protein
VEFEGVLEAARGGGCVVRLPDGAAFPTRRVKGSVGGVPYRSSLMPVGGGAYRLGVHKATREAAGAAFGDTVTVTVEPDEEPREVVVPDELRAALDADPVANAAWERLAPSHRREHANAVADAKKPETRARRVEKTLEALRARG